jgi:hypothetical protein
MVIVKNSIEAILRRPYNIFTGQIGTAVELCYKFTNYDNVFFERVNIENNYDYIKDDVGTPQSLTIQQKEIFVKGLSSWSNYANIKFRPCSEGEKVNFYFGAGYAKETFSGSSYAINKDEKSFAIIINNYSLHPYTVDTNFYFYTILHEIGQALGLSHPFDRGIRLPNDFNNKLYTVMSYKDIEFNSRIYQPMTPMTLDIMAIQYLYGKNKRYFPDNNIFSLSDQSIGAYSFWDSSGKNDIINFSLSYKDLTIDLREGYNYPSTISHNAIFYLAIGSNIEGVRTGHGGDTLIGNQLDNSLYAGSGINSLTGGAGKDSFIFNRNDTGHNIITDFKISEDKLILEDNFQGSFFAKEIFLGNNFHINITDELSLEINVVY